MLISRLVLNLRNYNEHSAQANVPDLSLPPVRFTQVEHRVLGSIGAPMDYGQWEPGNRFDVSDDIIEQDESQEQGDAEAE